LGQPPKSEGDDFFLFPLPGRAGTLTLSPKGREKPEEIVLRHSGVSSKKSWDAPEIINLDNLEFFGYNKILCLM